MNEKYLTCPKCQNKMLQGFVADFAHAQIVVSTWVEGLPEKSFWLGTKVPQEKSIKISTFRCSGCGYLESYAQPEVAR